MTDKERYKKLCAGEPSIPIYSRDWWLDCVCGEKKWDVLLYQNGEDIEAVMPYYTPCKWIISMPPYTQSMGIWFNPECEKENYSKNLSRKHIICNYFIQRLPKHTFFVQNFHYLFTDWLPFYWKGYSQTTRYSYILPDIRNIKEIEKNMSYDMKYDINKAQKKYQIEIKTHLNVDLFLEINAKTYERQGKKSYQPEILRRLIEIAYSRNEGNIWGAFDKSGQLLAAVFVAWQKNCAYYIAGGSNSLGRKSSAQAYALWKAIVDMAEKVQMFDFSGSMLQGVEHFFREFGTVQLPYSVITKGRMDLIKKILFKIRTLKK